VIAVHARQERAIAEHARQERVMAEHARQERVIAEHARHEREKIAEEKNRKDAHARQAREIAELAKKEMERIAEENKRKAEDARLQLFEAAKKRKKFVIFVVNSEYDSNSEFDDLPGTLENLEAALKIFEKLNYVTHVIPNSKDILTEVRDYVENKDGFKDSARDVFQLLYLGHGCHKNIIYKHEGSYLQKGQLGDCLVNVDGTFCAELELALCIGQNLAEKTKICLMYDMCREQTRQQPKPFYIETSNYDWKQIYEDIEADERTVKVFSTKLDQLAGDNNSFLGQICHEIATKSPEGIKFKEMNKFNKVKGRVQKCKIEKAIELDDEYWPLG